MFNLLDTVDQLNHHLQTLMLLLLTNTRIYFHSFSPPVLHSLLLRTNLTLLVVLSHCLTPLPPLYLLPYLLIHTTYTTYSSYSLYSLNPLYSSSSTLLTFFCLLILLILFVLLLMMNYNNEGIDRNLRVPASINSISGRLPGRHHPGLDERSIILEWVATISIPFVPLFLVVCL